MRADSNAENRTPLLERVALALSSTLELREVLRRLADVGREASGARRCTVLLLDAGRLRPAVALTARPDEDLWAAFRSMPPVELGDAEWELVHAGRAVAFADAADSPYIPVEWRERFDLKAVAIVPIVAHGRAHGIIAFDWPEVRHFSADDIATLEAVGAYAGLAVHNAVLHQRVAQKTRLLEHVVEVAAALNSSSSAVEVLSLVCMAFEQVIGATHVSVNLSDEDDPGRLRTLARRGEPWFRRGGFPVHPEELVAVETITQTPAGPVVYPSIEALGTFVTAPRGVRSAALFPLFGPAGVVGAVLAGFALEGGPEGPELEAGQALAELAAAAISRADLQAQVEAVHLADPPSAADATPTRDRAVPSSLR